MKTIGERAIEYATITDPLRPGDAPRIAMRVDECLAEAFIGGAISERAELTRWNDSKESEPASGTLVLGKYHNDDPDEVGYVVCQYVDGWFYAPDGECLNREDEPTHWRPIRE